VLATFFEMNFVVSSPTFSIYLYVAKPGIRVLATTLGKNVNCFELHYCLFFILPKADERMLTTAFEKICLVNSPTIGRKPYVAQSVEQVLASAFGKN